MGWVLITGATAGIGREAALAFARAGLSVIASGRDPERLGSLEAEARTLGLSLSTVVLDVTDERSIASAATSVGELTSGHGLDVLVNNAGFGEMAPLETIPLARVRAMFETNVVGLARVTRAFLPTMRARGVGRVVNVSSLMGRMVVPAQGAYAASKHAVEALSDALRREVEPFGVSVVVLEPGAVARRSLPRGARARSLGASRSSGCRGSRCAACARRARPTRRSRGPHRASGTRCR